MPPMIVVCQVDDQLLKTTLRDEKMITHIGPSHHIEGREVLDHAGIKDEPVAEGLEAQDNASAPATN